MAFMLTLKAVVDELGKGDEEAQSKDIKECRKMYEYLEANK